MKEKQREFHRENHMDNRQARIKSLLACFSVHLISEASKERTDSGRGSQSNQAKQKMARFVLATILLVVLLTDRSRGFMGWYGNSGKKPSGRRSIIEVSCKQTSI